MEIIVQGTSSKYFTPNEVILNINFTTKKNSYEVALNEGVRNVQVFVDTILLPNGFSKEDMKTKSFVVKEEKKYNEATRKYEFAGYSFNQNATLKFDYDKEKLAHIMVQLSRLDNAPSCHINFGIKDEKACRKTILAGAYQDAEFQAQAIAQAAGKNLKQCIKVDFQPFTTNYLSQTNMEGSMLYKSALGANPDSAIINTFTPEDIELTETLYCLWIAE